MVGPVGSGKSSLLSAVLGEMHCKAGKVAVAGNVAYVSQVAWIPNDSLKNAYSFWQFYGKARYQSIINSCGLRRSGDFRE